MKNCKEARELFKNKYSYENYIKELEEEIWQKIEGAMKSYEGVVLVHYGHDDKKCDAIIEIARKYGYTYAKRVPPGIERYHGKPLSEEFYSIILSGWGD